MSSVDWGVVIILINFLIWIVALRFIDLRDCACLKELDTKVFKVVRHHECNFLSNFSEKHSFNDFRNFSESLKVFLKK